MRLVLNTADGIYSLILLKIDSFKDACQGCSYSSRHLDDYAEVANQNKAQYF